MLQRLLPYALVFVITGSIAVAIKVLGEHAESRVAGIVAMVPIKILIAWVLLAGDGGGAAVRQGTEGMFVGLAAMVALLGTAWWAAGRFGIAGVLALSLVAWAAVVVALGRWTGAAGPRTADATAPGEDGIGGDRGISGEDRAGAKPGGSTGSKR